MLILVKLRFMCVIADIDSGHFLPAVLIVLLINQTALIVN